MDCGFKELKVEDWRKRRIDTPQLRLVYVKRFSLHDAYFLEITEEVLSRADVKLTNKYETQLYSGNPDPWDNSWYYEVPLRYWTKMGVIHLSSDSTKEVEWSERTRLLHPELMNEPATLVSEYVKDWSEGFKNNTIELSWLQNKEKQLQEQLKAEQEKLQSNPTKGENESK